MRTELVNNIQTAFEKSAKRYNLRSRAKTFKIGDAVYRRNFALSDKAKKFNSKLAPVFVKSTFLATKGNNMFQLRDIENGKVGWYHSKDIKETKG